LSPIRHARLLPYRLPLCRPWRTQHGERTLREGWLIELVCGDQVGYGECAPLPEAGTETAQTARHWLSERLTTLPGGTPQQALTALPAATDCPAARCGLETALLDLLARARGLSLHRLLAEAVTLTAAATRAAQGDKRPRGSGLPPRLPPVDPAPQVAVENHSYKHGDAMPLAVSVNANLGTLDAGVAARAAAAIREGYGILKLKVGLAAPTTEATALRHLCESLPAGIRLRLDANSAWSFAEAHGLLRAMADAPIEGVEEPLGPADRPLLGRLQQQLPFPLAWDESLPALLAAAPDLAAQARRWVLKPMVLGGLLPALGIGRQAAGLGIETLVTSTLESACGLWACAQLAAALDPEARQTHGLATADWLGEHPGDPPAIAAGRLRLPDGSGSGFIPA